MNLIKRMKNKICEHCRKNNRKTKPYIIADNLEEPRWLCKECKYKLDWDILLAISEITKNDL